MSILLLKPASSLKTAEPFSAIFPIKPTTLEAVTASMGADGFDQSEPIVIWNDTVIDGHTRLSAALASGIDLVPTVARDFSDEDEALEYAIKRQRDRRNLTDKDLLRCVGILDSRKDKSNNLNIGPEAPHGASGESDGKSAAKTAAILGTSARKVERARAVLDHATDEAKEQVMAGEKSINAAYNETREPAPKPKAQAGECPRCRELQALLAEREEECRELISSSRANDDLFQSMVRTLDADDQQAQARAEVKRFTELNRVLQERLNGKMTECHGLAQDAKRWMNKFLALERKFKALDRDETFQRGA